MKTLLPFSLSIHNSQWPTQSTASALDCNGSTFVRVENVPIKEAVERASFIIHACNSHSVMYQLLCEMYDFAAQIDDEDSRMPADLMDTARQIFKSMEAAK